MKIKAVCLGLVKRKDMWPKLIDQVQQYLNQKYGIVIMRSNKKSIQGFDVYMDMTDETLSDYGTYWCDYTDEEKEEYNEEVGTPPSEVNFIAVNFNTKEYIAWMCWILGTDKDFHELPEKVVSVLNSLGFNPANGI